MNLILKILLSLITPIAAHTDIQLFENNPVIIQWPNYGNQYEYSVEIYKDEDISENLIFTSEWISKNKLEIQLERGNLYLWKLYIKELNKDCTEDHQCLNIESGYFYLSSEIDTTEIEDNIEEEVPLPESEETIDEKEEVLGIEVEKSSNKEPIPKKKEEIKEEEEEVLNIVAEENSCVYKYNIDKEKFTLEDCNIEIPKILSSTYQKYKDEYIVKSNGKHIDSINVYINTVSCRNFDILDPKTWFKCQEVYIRSDEYKDIQFNHEVYFLDNFGY